jgi:hypothetical protein
LSWEAWEIPVQLTLIVVLVKTRAAFWILMEDTVQAGTVEAMMSAVKAVSV